MEFDGILYLVVYKDDTGQTFTKHLRLIKKDESAYYFYNSKLQKREILTKLQVVRMEEIKDENRV